MIGIRESIDNFKQEIKDSDYEKYESRNNKSDSLYGTLFIKERMDYGFHLYFIHEPSERDPLAGKYGTVSEMFYDLRNKIYWIKRNLKEVKFSVRNVDSVFPYGDRNEIFNRLSTKANKGLYSAAFQFLGAMGDERTEMFGRFFYRLITQYSYFELLHKAGVKFNKHTRIVNPNGNSPMEILGLSKTQWKIISKFNLPIDKFDLIKNDNADNKMINYLSYIKSLEDEFGIEKASSFFGSEFGHLYDKYSYRSALQIAEYYNLPVKNFLKYIYFECDVSQGLSDETAISQYSDYIRMTKEMGYERFERYPKFLRTAHDIASRNYQIKLNEIEMKEWDASYENNKHFEYSYDRYKIFPPKEPSDLVREGNVLGHCVGSYVHKVRKGISAILFLRDKDDMECPLVTIEVKDNRICQSKGKMNNPPSREQSDVIKKFAEKYKLAI